MIETQLKAGDGGGWGESRLEKAVNSGGLSADTWRKRSQPGRGLPGRGAINAKSLRLGLALWFQGTEGLMCLRRCTVSRENSGKDEIEEEAGPRDKVLIGAYSMWIGKPLGSFIREADIIWRRLRRSLFLQGSQNASRDVVRWLGKSRQGRRGVGLGRRQWRWGEVGEVQVHFRS